MRFSKQKSAKNEKRALNIFQIAVKIVQMQGNLCRMGFPPFIRGHAEMFTETAAEITRRREPHVVGDVRDALAGVCGEVDERPLHAHGQDEVVRGLTSQALQFELEQRTAHADLAGKDIDIERRIGQIALHDPGSLIEQLPVPRTHR